MVNEIAVVSVMGSDELRDSMKKIAAVERVVGVAALIRLGEIEKRSLYADEGYPTMFAYCVGELRYSESLAWGRIQAARKARLFPEILSLIRDGLLTVCALSRLANHLTAGNRATVLKQAEGKSIREVQKIVAALHPAPDTVDLVRSVKSPPCRRQESSIEVWPEASPTKSSIPTSLPIDPDKGIFVPMDRPDTAPADVEEDIASHPRRSLPTRQKIIPLAPGRVQFGFTGSEELRDILDRLRDLLWHKFPDGRIEDILLEVGRDFLARKDPQLLPTGKVKAPRKTETRMVPRWVRSMVYRRDGGRCVFTNTKGRRCEARRSLEYDHIHPWALGGRSDDPKNIRLLCRTHNQLAAKISFPESPLAAGAASLTAVAKP